MKKFFIGVFTSIFAILVILYLIGVNSETEDITKNEEAVSAQPKKREDNKKKEKEEVKKKELLEKAYSTKANVTVNKMKIIEDNLSGENVIIALYAIVENIGNETWHANSASFSLATSDGLVGETVPQYTVPDWKTFEVQDLQKGQRYEGSILFELPKSESYTLTYEKYFVPIQFNLPGNEGDFSPVSKTINAD